MVVFARNDRNHSAATAAAWYAGLEFAPAAAESGSVTVVLAALHDECDIAKYGYIARWVALDSDEVRQQAGLHPAHLVLDV